MGARGGRNADQLVTDYLSALGDHLRYTLREKLGHGVINSIPLEFVVTVPAIWSDLAKDKTMKACKRAAGLSTSNASIHLISEPEAAAIYALHGLDPHGLELGDSFVVCDAGGGTVDLISYTVSKLKPILEVQETSPGTGALCGSAFLNMRFAKFLKAKLGKEEGFDDEVLAEAMDKFEKSIKRQFTVAASPDEIYTIPVGGLANNKALGISRGRYALKASDLQAIFEPVVLEVIKLVKGQIATSKVEIRAVLLVGGFGASNYLKERLRNAVGDKINVLQPSNAWLAVVQGAVMKGLALSAPKNTMVSVGARRARKHYGYEATVECDRKIHRGLDRTWDGCLGHWRVSAIIWFLRRGDVVSENKPVNLEFHFRQRVSLGRIRDVGLTVFADRTGRDAPIAKDDEVTTLCKLTANISHIPEKLLQRCLGKDGKWYYDLKWKLEVVHFSASTTYTLLYNGQRYNTVVAEYV